jgi:hypothetical protein
MFMRLRSFRALVSLSFLITLNLAAAPRDVVALRNWTVPSAGAAHPPASVNTLTLTNPTTFTTLSPCRLVDTRNAPGAFGGPAFNAGETRSYNIAAGGCGAPAVAAYSLNFTIVNYTGRGNLKAYATGTGAPVTSISNFGSGLPVGNAAIVAGDVNGSIDVTISGNTNVIIDINGYFKEGVVTGLTAGKGLTITGSNNFTVTLAAGGVGANEINAGEVQKRVTGMCAGGAINAVNGDGTVACATINGGGAGAQLFLPGPHTFTVPAGVTLLEVEAWAGGGGGASAVGNPGFGGGGGGYGRVFLTVTAGQQLDIMVGAGGTGGSNGAGGDGGDTTVSFQGTLHLTINGGKGGTAAAHGAGGGVYTGGTLIQMQLGSGGGGQFGGNAGLNGGTLGLGGDGTNTITGNTGQPGFMRIIPSP